MRIEVTAEDVSAGIIRSWSWNPVARAIRRAMPSSDPVLSGEWWWLLLKGERVRVAAPRSAVEALAAFHKGKGMRPFALDVASESDP